MTVWLRKIRPGRFAEPEAGRVIAEGPAQPA